MARIAALCPLTSHLTLAFSSAVWAIYANRAVTPAATVTTVATAAATYAEYPSYLPPNRALSASLRTEGLNSGSST